MDRTPEVLPVLNVLPGCEELLRTEFVAWLLVPVARVEPELRTVFGRVSVLFPLVEFRTASVRGVVPRGATP